MSTRRGLNVPTRVRATPLDELFTRLEQFLVLEDASPSSALQQLVQKLEEDPQDDPLQQMNALADKCFKYIDDIQRLSLQKQQRQLASGDPEKSSLITISLHDMKFFNDLLNVIVIQLIYPLLPKDVGIPLEQRRLKSFAKRLKIFQYQRVSGELHPLMITIVTRFSNVFSLGGDVSELLIKGSGLTDVLTLLMVLLHEDNNSSWLQMYQLFESKSDTYNLFGIYTALLQTTRAPVFKTFLSSRLSHITINRQNGVISLIDFIVGIRDDEEVNIDKFNSVNKVLMSKPKDISSVDYFNKMFDQIYDILVHINRPVLLSVVVNFIRVLYNKNKRIIQDFLFKRIWKTWNPKLAGFDAGDTVIVEKDLNDSTNVLISLTKESSPEFLNDLFSQIVLSLWSYFFYLKKNKLEYSTIVSNILVSFFTITSNNEFLENIILNLINSHGEGWIFRTTLENKLTSIVKSSPLDNELTNYQILEDIDLGLIAICELLADLNNDIVRTQFISVMNRWILKQEKVSTNLEMDDNPFIMLIDLKFLEKVNEKFKDALMDKPEDILLVIKNLLHVRFENVTEQPDSHTEVDSDDEDDDLDETNGNLNILLELLSAIISETPPQVLTPYKETLTQISKLLEQSPNDKHCVALKSRIDDLLEGDHNPVGQDDELSRDKELFTKAITNMNDPLIPIRAHGLYLLRQLIMKKSPVLTLDFVLELHIVQLQDNEPFIYLNVIKSLNELIDFDKQGTVEFLLKTYQNTKEKLDDRLKIGEVLVNFIDRQGELLTGDLVFGVMGATLNVIRDFEEDDKMRMSAISLLGESLRTNALGLEKFIKDSLDCAIGVLELEKTDIMKRAAVVLISDLISFGGLDIVPRGYGAKLQRVLRYEKMRASDYLLVEQITKVESIIEDLKRDKLTPSAPSQFDKLKIAEL